MTVSQKFGTGSGDGLLETQANTIWGGALQLVKFDTVASVGNGAVVGTVQERFFVNRPFRIKGVFGAASGKAGATDPTFTVYAGATPAAVHTAVTLDAADAIKAGVVTAPGTLYPAGIVSLRAVTAADGTITNLKGYVELELLPA